jgi:NAD(P)-dependent dehydrogenase (short-subunit alcohol dehydrogenase family)
VHICIPAAGIVKDALAVRLSRDNGHALIYPLEDFERVISINLTAAIYWALGAIASVAEDRRQRGLGEWQPDEGVQGGVIFIGSISSAGNRGQISYATAKAGLEGAQATLATEAIFHGIRSAIIHPGFTDTPMVQALGEEFVQRNILPYTQLKRLIRPEEIADAICFMLKNSSVSGVLWADAGWHPAP